MVKRRGTIPMVTAVLVMMLMFTSVSKVALAKSDTIQTVKFYKSDANIFNTFTLYNTSDEIITKTKARSNIECGKKCALLANSCTSFSYNTSTQECLLAATTDELLAQAPDIKTLQSICDMKKGFRAYTSNNVAACLARITETKNWSAAQKTCKQLGGFLASVKTSDKLKLLQRFPPPNYIGLSDISFEGRFVWEEDGEVAFSTPPGVNQITQAHAQMPGLWQLTAPSNSNDNQHCVELDYPWDKCSGLIMLNDEYCSKEYPVLCQMGGDILS